MNCTNEHLANYISIIHRQASVFFTKEFSKFGIGFGQYMFMIYLYKQDGITQDNLSDLLNIDKGTTAKAVKKLEHLGYLTRSKDFFDKRINRIHLTEKALDIKPEFFNILSKWEKILTKNLSNDEILNGLTILNKLSQNVIKR